MQVSESRIIAATPDAVWQIGGDTANVAAWVPAIAASHQRGDTRYLTFADGGGEATERIIDHDALRRRYTYEYIDGPLPLQSYRSSFAVADHPDGAEVTWSAQFRAVEPDAEPDLAAAIGDIYRSALEELAVVVGGGRHGDAGVGPDRGWSDDRDRS